MLTAANRVLAGMVLAGMMIPATVDARHRPREHRHDKVSAGDIVGGLLLVGLVAALAAKPKKPPLETVNAPTLDPADAAVNVCAEAIEDHIDDDGGYGRVESVSAVEPTEKGFTVRGLVRMDEGTLFNRDGRLAKFRCSVRPTGVRSLSIG